ncbi:MAG: nucleoside-diphosphate sugar epimerase/dehydratase [Acidobacteria bacterium]|nr:nucleoside-diphosphate sugar epimerase/dehydratase [Acidobacteriota bacterium]
MKKNRMLRFVLAHRQFLLAVLHGVLIVGAILVAFLLRFEYTVPAEEASRLTAVLWLALVVKLPVFVLRRHDRGWWQYSGIVDLQRLAGSNVLASALFAAAAMAAMGPGFPRSIFVIDFLLCFLATAGLRFSVRVYREGLGRDRQAKGPVKGMLIYGAGQAGLSIAKEIRSNPSLGYDVIGLLDDSPAKQGATLAGATVLGTGREAALIVEMARRSHRPVAEILIAMPSAGAAQMREAVANCRSAGVPFKTIPGVGEMLTGKVLTSQIREVSVVDLLGREPVELDEAMIREQLQGRCVLVTGAGGSIGSEICRQVAGYDPRRLVLLDQAESDLFRIHLELLERYSEERLAPAVADICDPARLEELIRYHEVDVIVHAAAYKHVPMMECHLFEAVRNNVIGTYNLVEAAARHGVSRFLMISTDKAVNPTNIMGLTKRVAELIVTSKPGLQGKTEYVAVRFGNVLGSNGSVIPLFRKQIAAGGPITVTHPEMQRYFMTIPEAVQLVLQASAMGKGAEIFVLDMGEPVKILDLAQNMARLSGKTPGVDIEIRYTGLRPGEKLFEELSMEGEDFQPTHHNKIKIYRGRRMARSQMREWVGQVRRAVTLRDEGHLLGLLKDLVPEYQPSGRYREILAELQQVHPSSRSVSIV